MQKIVPHLWYDKQAEEAAQFYVSTFPDSKILSKTMLYETPSGTVDVMTFKLINREFQAIGAGPEFRFNPSISFHVICKTIEEVEAIWKKLSAGGSVLMELGAYPFSERYGWLQDRYGLSWQVIYSGGAEVKRKITPVIMFVGGVSGKAEEAVNFWISIFEDSKVNSILHFGKGEEPDKEGSLKYGSFALLGQEFGAMDSAHPHPFSFNEAISFMVKCDTQAEIDHYWSRLSAVAEAEQCGWLKDKYGLSWQVTPTVMEKLLGSGDLEKTARVTQAFLPMKKLELAKLWEAFNGK